MPSGLSETIANMILACGGLGLPARAGFTAPGCADVKESEFRNVEIVT